MKVVEIILYICIWSIAGFIAWLVLGGCFDIQAIMRASGIEFVNPWVIYKQTRVNWFGAIVVATLYGVMCPVATCIYWLYKLYTVGRK